MEDMGNYGYTLLGQYRILLDVTFEEWFTGNKENFSKNYSVLPKDSLVSKEGLETDLERLKIEGLT